MRKKAKLNRKDSAIELIGNHPFFQENMQQVVQKSLLFYNKKVKYNEVEEYIGGVLRKAAHLAVALSELDKIELYFSTTFRKLKRGDVEISSVDNLRYHLENYYLRAWGLIDKMCLVINGVYELGLSAGDAKIELMGRMPDFKKNKVVQYIKKLKKGTKKIARVRHLISHEEQYTDKDLSEVEMFRIVGWCSTSNSSDAFIKQVRALHMGRLNEYRVKRLKEMRRNNDELFIIVKGFFDIIYPEFKRRIEYKMSKEKSAHSKSAGFEGKGKNGS